ncbi:MAG: acetamidase/formamidase family protein [Chloroflexota bacterium]|nr:acetamidase/formamidase family protein [Chloroflexota bacterium]
MGAGGRMHHLGTETVHTFWDNALPPRLTVAPGDTVVFQTLEASYGAVAREVARETPPDLAPELVALIAADAYPERPVELRGHPLTGPVALAGAAPGDTLVVEIIEVRPNTWGWTAASPIGLLSDEIPGRTLQYWDLRGGDSTTFAPGIRLPLAPFCGVMGVAPAEPGRHPTAPPRAAGGNMDIRQLVAGTTLHLPVLATGALFSVGDAHAAQGDGEVSGTGIETDATVTLRFDLLRGQTIRAPRFRTAGPAEPGAKGGPYFAATGHDPHLREAAREALRGVLDWLEREHDLPRARASILASVCVDLRISQIVDAPNWTVSAFLPLSIFAD